MRTVVRAMARRIHTFVTTEGVDGPGARLKSRLTDKKRCEANKRLYKS